MFTKHFKTKLFHYHQNKKITADLIATWNGEEMKNGTTKECNFEDYLLLSMRYGNYGNVQHEITVDSSWFSTTSYGKRPQFCIEGKYDISIYQNGANQVRIHGAGSSLLDVDNFWIYGIIKK